MALNNQSSLSDSNMPQKANGLHEREVVPVSNETYRVPEKVVEKQKASDADSDSQCILDAMGYNDVSQMGNNLNVQNNRKHKDSDSMIKVELEYTADVDGDSAHNVVKLKHLVCGKQRNFETEQSLQDNGQIIFQEGLEDNNTRKVLLQKIASAERKQSKLQAESLILQGQISRQVEISLKSCIKYMQQL